MDLPRVGSLPSSDSVPSLPAQAVSAPQTGVELAELTAPPVPETANARRRIAIKSIRQQREAVRQRLLASRLESLPQLEARWRAEIESEYDLARWIAEWDAEWFQAFQAYGRQRFFPLFETVFYPSSDSRHKQAQLTLSELAQRFTEQETQLQQALQARLGRVEQEIAVRMRAKRRAFERQVEQEVDQILASQPDLCELYLPMLERLPPTEALRSNLPLVKVQFSEEDLDRAVRLRIDRAERVQAQILRRLATEWATSRG
ncbi:MAG: hypothetical protein C4336_03505 [Armatimonadota bacterium]